MATDRVVVVGAAGFGRECLDVLEAMIGAGADLAIAGVVDDAPTGANLDRLRSRGIPFMGTISDWLAAGVEERYVLGIGHPAVRREIVAALDEAAAVAVMAVHPDATVGTATSMGEGVVVCAGVTISTNVRLGRHVHVNPSATIGHDSVIDDFVSVNPAATISGDVRIHREVLVGAGSLVLQRLTIGERTTVGAAALVTKDVPSGVVVTGVPGRWNG